MGSFEEIAGGAPQHMTLKEHTTINRESQESAMSTGSAIHCAEKPLLRWLRLEAPDDGLGNGHVAIASYPRSGNTLMRALMEQVTGIYTGSDTLPERSLGKALKEAGFKGEGIVDGSVRFIKTHFPERSGYKSFRASKCILLVRNPYDAFDSYFNMIMTKSHNTTMHDSQYKRFRKVWDKMVRNEIKIWRKFYRYWLSQDIPVIIVRYEDLLHHRKEMLIRTMKFLSEKDSLEGTGWLSRIESVINESKQTERYKPRKASVGGSFERFNISQRRWIVKHARRDLQNFGYGISLDVFSYNSNPPSKNVKSRSACASSTRLAGNSNAFECVLNDGSEMREPGDIFGRSFTQVRLQLTDPVIDTYMRALNMDEVLAARAREEAAASTADGVETEPSSAVESGTREDAVANLEHGFGSICLEDKDEKSEV